MVYQQASLLTISLTSMTVPSVFNTVSTLQLVVVVVVVVVAQQQAHLSSRAVAVAVGRVLSGATCGV
jgi:hypothetical protein